MEDKLQIVLEMTKYAHKGQKRKLTNEPYFQHPLRVMHRCEMVSADVCLLSAALLHDVLEKTTVTEMQLRSELARYFNTYHVSRILSLVLELTNVYNPKDYPQKNYQQRQQLEADRLKMISPDGQTIKYADIIDNCDKIALEEPSNAQKSIKEYSNLLQVMHNGNIQLYGLAITAVRSVQLKHAGNVRPKDASTS